MKKSAAVFIALIIPFVLALVLLRMYFGVAPMSSERFIAVFVEMPDFGRQVVAEFQKLQSLLTEVQSYAIEIGSSTTSFVVKVLSGDLLQMVTGIFEYLGSIFAIIGKFWWLFVRSFYYFFAMVGLLLLEPVNIVVYFISAIVSPF